MKILNKILVSFLTLFLISCEKKIDDKFFSLKSDKQIFGLIGDVKEVNLEYSNWIPNYSANTFEEDRIIQNPIHIAGITNVYQNGNYTDNIYYINEKSELVNNFFYSLITDYNINSYAYWDYEIDNKAKKYKIEFNTKGFLTSYLSTDIDDNEIDYSYKRKYQNDLLQSLSVKNSINGFDNQFKFEYNDENLVKKIIINYNTLNEKPITLVKTLSYKKIDEYHNEVTIIEVNQENKESSTTILLIKNDENNEVEELTIKIFKKNKLNSTKNILITRSDDHKINGWREVQNNYVSNFNFVFNKDNKIVQINNKNKKTEYNLQNNKMVLTGELPLALKYASPTEKCFFEFKNIDSKGNWKDMIVKNFTDEANYFDQVNKLKNKIEYNNKKSDTLDYMMRNNMIDASLYIQYKGQFMSLNEIANLTALKMMYKKYSLNRKIEYY